VERGSESVGLSVVIPAYNEAANIRSTLEAALAFLGEEGGGEVIVVDDGSTDETGAVVEALAREHPQVRLLRNERNRGKGHAVRRGVLEAKGRLILFCDADGSTPFSEARKLFARLESGEADIAIGSREMPDSDLARPQPRYRRVMGWVFRRLVAALVVRGFRDTQCGFKAFRAEAARDVFRRLRLDGFAFDVEVVFVARRLGYRVAEVGVRWLDSGQSRVRPVRDSLRMLRDLFRIRLNALKGRYG